MQLAHGMAIVDMVYGLGLLNMVFPSYEVVGYV